ncbi:hypothetical protein MMC26_000565 [Xylographa opegraphella]|nr:hypothetical protein [Xylographa opegraphella]
MDCGPPPRPWKSSSQVNPNTGFDPGRIPDVLAAKADLRYLTPDKSDFGYEPIKPELRTMNEDARQTSVAGSSTSRLSYATAQDEQDIYGDDEEEESAIAAAEQDDDLTGDDVPRTAAERRAEKRKMKRFRLTHNQTRFLMSEFARQPHPDAAQRERLSRDIPGLTARQVQVWFQNRRAKLKRFTSDDRERMMSTRALPEGFDMSQALHSPLESQPYTNALLQAPATSTASYPSTFHDGGAMGPLLADHFRHPLGNGGNTLPGGTHPVYRSYYTPPGSGAGSENASPISSISGRKHPDGHALLPSIESQSSIPFNISAALSTAQFPHAQVPRFPFRDSMPRTQAELLSLPRRAGISSVNITENYGQPATSFVDYHPQQMTQDHLTRLSSDTTGSGPGSGFLYGPAGTYQSPAISPRLPDLTSYIPEFETRSQSRSNFPSAGYSQSNAAQAFPNVAQSITQVSPLPDSHIHYGNTALHNDYAAGYNRLDNHYLRSTSSVGERNVEDVMHEEHLRRNATFHR